MTVRRPQVKFAVRAKRGSSVRFEPAKSGISIVRKAKTPCDTFILAEKRVIGHQSAPKRGTYGKKVVFRGRNGILRNVQAGKRVKIVEVGLRDGLQNERGNLTTEQKLRYIERLIAADIQEIEVGSFVHPKLVPAMADTKELQAGGRG